MKQELEIVKFSCKYHSIRLNKEIVVRDSSLPLEINLSICFKKVGKLENISIETVCFEDHLEYEKYLEC